MEGPPPSSPLPSFDLTPLPERQASSGPPPPPPPRRKSPSSAPPPRASQAESVAAPPSGASAPSIPDPAPVPTESENARVLEGFARLAAFVDGRRAGWPAKIRAALQRLPGSPRDRAALALGALLFTGIGAGLHALLRSPASSPQKVAAAPDELPASLGAAPEKKTTAAPPANAPAPLEGEPSRSTPKETEIQLDHAERLLEVGRQSEVLPLIDRLLARQPELKNDPRLARMLLKTGASSDAQVAAKAFTLVKGPMGEAGAAVAYELSLSADAKVADRKRAELWLASKEFERVSSLQVYAAVKLRRAESCGDKHALLTFAGNVGGKYVLDYLRELDRKSVCSPEALDDCFSCMRNDSKLTTTISKLEAEASSNQR